MVRSAILAASTGTEYAHKASHTPQRLRRGYASSKQDVNDDMMTQLKSRLDEFARPSDQIKRTRAALDNNRTPFCLGFDLTNPNL